MSDVNSNGVDLSTIAVVQGDFDTGYANAAASGKTIAVGSPVQPEIRQTRPVTEMGAGYREGSEDDAW
jgi:hypothetical protein